MDRTPLPDDVKKGLGAQLAVLQVFQEELRDTMPAQYVATFLLVAMNEGLSVVEYADKAKVNNTTMSRHLLDIGERNRHMEPGFGLVTYRPHPMELRKHEYFLTPKGKALANKVAGLLGRG